MDGPIRGGRDWPWTVSCAYRWMDDPVQGGWYGMDCPHAVPRWTVWFVADGTACPGLGGRTVRFQADGTTRAPCRVGSDMIDSPVQDEGHSQACPMHRAMRVRVDDGPLQAVGMARAPCRVNSGGQTAWCVSSPSGLGRMALLAYGPVRGGWHCPHTLPGRLMWTDDMVRASRDCRALYPAGSSGQTVRWRADRTACALCLVGLGGRTSGSG